MERVDRYPDVCGDKRFALPFPNPRHCLLSLCDCLSTRPSLKEVYYVQHK